MIFQFDSLMDFFLMEGHGVFVWSSYFITGVTLKLLILLPLLKRRSIVSQLKRQQRLEQVQNVHPQGSYLQDTHLQGSHLQGSHLQDNQ